MPSLRAEARLPGFKHRIRAEKICLVTRIIHINKDEENYARDILEEQLKNNWGGLTEEVTTICQQVGLPDGCKEYLDRKEVQDAILQSG